MYGVDAYVAFPPISIAISILLISGVSAIGSYIQSQLLKGLVINNKWLAFQSPVIGSLVIGFILYVSALNGFAHKDFVSLIGWLIITIGLINLARTIKRIVEKKYIYTIIDCAKKNKIFLIIIIQTCGYFIYSLSPITNADSLDYHLGVAIEVLNSGEIYSTPEWFHSRLASIGEVLNALALSVGAEQFASILQFLSLLSIVSVIIYNSESSDDIKYFIAAAILSSPLLIQLIGTAKHQLLPIAAIFASASILLIKDVWSLNLMNSDIKRIYIYVLMLIMFAALTRYNYMLSGGFFAILLFVRMIKKGMALYALSVGALLFALIMIYPLVYKSLVFGGGWFDGFITPLPGNDPGLIVMLDNLRDANESTLPFPLSLFLPSSLGNITTIFGFWIFFIILIKLKDNLRAIVVALVALTLFVLIAIFGPSSSRSYLIPILILSLVFTINPADMLTRTTNIFLLKLIVYVQSLFFLIPLFFGVVTTIPAIASSNYRSDVMSTQANGYQLVEWLDMTLPQEAVILSMHRSIALFPRKTISFDWSLYSSDEKRDLTIYFKRIVDQEVSHVLLYGDYKNTSGYKLVERCIIPSSGITTLIDVATRNPFNHKKNLDIYIFQIDEKLLPSCLG